MVRRLVKLAFLVVIVVAAVGFLSGYWTADWWKWRSPGPKPAGTSGVLNPEAIRREGAELTDKAARAAERLDETLTDGALTAKIKSKMALDDFVKARNIDVDTTDSVVTLGGVVYSDAERQRAVQLARETRGVKSVVDRLKIIMDR